MRNERFFTYVRRHPIASFIVCSVSLILFIYGLFSLVVVEKRFTGEMYNYGISFSCTMMIGSMIFLMVMAVFMHDVYRGELINNYFSLYYDVPGKKGIIAKVEVGGNRLEPVVVQKKNAPYSVRQYMGITTSLYEWMYNLPDGNDIHFIPSRDKAMIFLNDTIIMENDRIYYDRIDQIYGATNNQTGTEQSVQQPINAAPSQIPVNEAIGRTAPIAGLQSGNSYTLTALEGQFAGKNWNLDKAVMLGRDGNCCQITFSADTAGVSRVHCEVGCKEGSLYIRDLGSCYGTVLENGSIVNNYQEVKVENNTVFRLNNNEKFMLTK